MEKVIKFFKSFGNNHLNDEVGVEVVPAGKALQKVDHSITTAFCTDDHQSKAKGATNCLETE